MNHGNLIKVVLVITILAGISLYLMQDHSGVGVTDVQLNNSDNAAQLTGYLRIARGFELLKCKYNFMDENSQLVTSVDDDRINLSMGSFPINQTVNVTSDKVSKVQILVFDASWKNDTPIYNKTFQL
ncbi:MAG: hypothetical protein IJJ47_11630 [Methanosphaera sp.]|nr:hypothetical protein [Methanosphaera sp.]